MTEGDFLDDVHTHKGGIIYGIAEGFEVLVDKIENSLKFCIIDGLAKQLR